MTVKVEIVMYPKQSWVLELFYGQDHLTPMSDADRAFVYHVWESWDRTKPLPLETFKRLKKIYESLDEI